MAVYFLGMFNNRNWNFPGLAGGNWKKWQRRYDCTGKNVTDHENLRHFMKTNFTDLHTLLLHAKSNFTSSNKKRKSDRIKYFQITHKFCFFQHPARILPVTFSLQHNPCIGFWAFPAVENTLILLIFFLWWISVNWVSGCVQLRVLDLLSEALFSTSPYNEAFSWHISTGYYSLKKVVFQAFYQSTAPFTLVS